MSDMPSYAEVSRRISALLLARGEEWAGIPMSLPGFSLCVEDKNPWRDKVAAIDKVVNKDGPTLMEQRRAARENGDGTLVTVRNQWWSTRLRRHLAIGEEVARPGHFAVINVDQADYVRRFNMALETLFVGTQAWSLDTELTAIDALAPLLKPHLYDGYVMTGQFIETSRRSGITYVFRRCRPTIAFKDKTILCCLCLHPIAYYEGTHAGGMCPTDDVISHLLLMRGDEHLFWRRCNQHAPDRPEAGL